MPTTASTPTPTPVDARWSVLIDSPIGTVRMTGEAHAVTGIYLNGSPSDEAYGDHPGAEQARRQLEEYFAGDRTAFDLELRPEGTPFQLEVWEALREIPYGETISYGELARRVGRPGSSRAVGAANGRNPHSIVVPCHRVIGANGTLTGYGGGLERKAWLLDHERRVAGAQLPLGV